MGPEERGGGVGDCPLRRGLVDHGGDLGFAHHLQYFKHCGQWCIWRELTLRQDVILRTVREGRQSGNAPSHPQGVRIALGAVPPESRGLGAGEAGRTLEGWKLGEGTALTGRVKGGWEMRRQGWRWHGAMVGSRVQWRL